MILSVGRVRSGWISHHILVRRSIGLTESKVGSSFYSSKANTGKSKTPKPLSALPAKWSVGDFVAVKINNVRVKGVIEELRGSGWLTVRVNDDTTGPSTLKCRTSQLHKLEVANNNSGPLQKGRSEASSTKAPKISAPKPMRPIIPTAGVKLGVRPPSTIQDLDAEALPNFRASPSSTATLMFSAPNPIRPIIHPDAGMKPDFPPPPPTIHDLDAALFDRSNVTNRRDQELLEMVAHHAKYEKWVVFTDLHCAPSSLDTCLEVLARVHTLAVERQAGVLFLGDFWHHRGTLRVDCLNAVLEHFHGWTVPMVMIPGNHDQVTLEGHNHGLTPFENAYRVGNVSGPLIFSYPTKFRGALFVPHIRSVATMESILQSSLAQEASALFVHADVTGALMNDLVVSMDGIPAASFPSHKLIYSGHFHKPHTVQSSNGLVRVEYLGSPYETSLSEAQQMKSLAVLDKDWKCIETIPIDVGRRHFKVSSWDELSNLTWSSEGAGQLPSNVRPGDRIVASIPQEAMDRQSSDITDHIKKLRAGGVMVEIREVKSMVEPSPGRFVGDANTNEMSPEFTWRAYITGEEQRKSLSSDSASQLLKTGLEILREVETSEQGNLAESKPCTDLALTKVSLEGFGPFRDKVTYPLSKRGLVLLKGTNNDGGSDSNGSGKTSLAMAALWALTGSMDPRRALDGKVSDVVNDQSKVARVTLDGSLNGIPFSISRTKTSSKSTLVFQLGGEDLTTQSVKETQALIEERLGVSDSILFRTMFHGQHAINELLEATDARLKEELSLLVPLEIWQTAASLSRSKARESNKRSAEFEGMIAMRSKDLERLDIKRKQAEAQVIEKQKNVALLDTKITQRLDSPILDNVVDFAELETVMSELSTELGELDEKYSTVQLDRENSLAPLLQKIEAAKDSLDAARTRVQQDEREEYAAQLALKTTMDRIVELEQKWSINLTEETTNIVAPDVCPTCRQPIAAGDDHSHTLEDFALRMREEIDDNINKRKTAKQSVETISNKLDKSRLDFQHCDDALTSLEKEYAQQESEWQSRIDEIRKAMEDQTRERNKLSERMAEVARMSQSATRNDSETESMKMEMVSLEYATASLRSVEEEMQEVKSQLEEMQAEEGSQKKNAKTMADLADLFGQRGVQTFVLQNVVDLLQTCSQTYLDDLSDGAQRLSLSLDAGDKVLRTASVMGSDGSFRERPLATLSGGQWRRCSLALTFGFAELAARKGKFRPSFCVLDEPLTHLDRMGRAKVGEVIRKLLHPANADGGQGYGMMGLSTVLIILQDLAAEELEEAFDCIDEVIKDDSSSNVRVDGEYTI